MTSAATLDTRFRFALLPRQVWHLLAEYGDILLLQALTNYCKIHDIRNLAPRSRRTWSSKEADKDLTISALVNVHNKLHQTPLMFAAYHGRAEVVTFLLQQVWGRGGRAGQRCWQNVGKARREWSRAR